MNFYKINLEQLIIIYDDIDLEEGILKLRKKGGAGTHNGMRSVVHQLQSTNFIHVRIGTGKPVLKELLIAYVIEPLKDEQYEKLIPTIDKASKAVPDIISKGIEMAMNLYN